MACIYKKSDMDILGYPVHSECAQLTPLFFLFKIKELMEESDQQRQHYIQATHRTVMTLPPDVSPDSASA